MKTDNFENDIEFKQALYKLEKLLEENYKIPTTWDLIMSFCYSFLWCFFASYGFVYFIKSLVTIFL